MLNIVTNYYNKDKENLRDNAKDKYRNLCEEEKNRARAYERNRYHNMSEENKKKLKEYQKSHCEANKSRKSAESRNLIKKCMH